MRLKEIVSCWVTRDFATVLDVEHVARRFHAIGFQTTRSQPGHYVFKRGRSVWPTFDYNSEKLEVKVELIERYDGTTRLKVGNSGFPFEPWLMKSRFQRLADRLASDLMARGEIQPRPDEYEEATIVSDADEELAPHVLWLGVCIVMMLLTTMLSLATVLMAD